MASDDRPKLPRATLRDEKLYVEGEKEPYFQDREHTIRLRVRELTIHRGYYPENYRNPDAAKVLGESLRGIAKLEGGDRLAVVGLEAARTTPIEFHLAPIDRADTEKYDWPVIIGFRTYDWEFPDDDEGFWIQGHCTRQYFDDVLAAIRRGRVDNIYIEMKTMLWTRDKPPLFGPLNSRMTFYLAPRTDSESTEPENQHGNIWSLRWDEKFGLPPAKETKDELKPLKEADDEPKLQLVELPARLYSLLTALLTIAVALLMVMFLRH
jgi:hypothetical protein